MFLDEINIRIDGLSKADCPLLCGWALSNQLKVPIEQKADRPGGKGKLLLSDCLPAGTSVFSCFLTRSKTLGLPGF